MEHVATDLCVVCWCGASERYGEEECECNGEMLVMKFCVTCTLVALSSTKALVNKYAR